MYVRSFVVGATSSSVVCHLALAHFSFGSLRSTRASLGNPVICLARAGGAAGGGRGLRRRGLGGGAAAAFGRRRGGGLLDGGGGGAAALGGRGLALGGARLAEPVARGLHSPTSQLNLSRFGVLHTSPCPPV
jgi:hypothetical protein